jgi:hypothetical protein
MELKLTVVTAVAEVIVSRKNWRMWIYHTESQQSKIDSIEIFDNSRRKKAFGISALCPDQRVDPAQHFQYGKHKSLKRAQR